MLGLEGILSYSVPCLPFALHVEVNVPPNSLPALHSLACFLPCIPSATVLTSHFFDSDSTPLKKLALQKDRPVPQLDSLTKPHGHLMHGSLITVQKSVDVLGFSIVAVTNSHQVRN